MQNPLIAAMIVFGFYIADKYANKYLFGFSIFERFFGW